MMDVIQQNRLQQLKDRMIQEGNKQIKHIDNKIEDKGVITNENINNKIDMKKVVVTRGEIWLARLNGSEGSEQGGTRPVINVQNPIGNAHSTTIIVATITSQINKAKLPTHVEIKGCGLPKDSVVLLEQIRTIDKTRLISYIGKVDELMMKRIDMAKEISTSDLKPKNTLERLPLDSQKYIINKLKFIDVCKTSLGFLHMIKGDKYSIGLAENEKFREENSLMTYCDMNKINYNEVCKNYNELKRDEENDIIAL